MKNAMTLKQAAEKAGVPYPSAARWAQDGIIRVSGGGGPRQGYICGEKELRELRIVKKLRGQLSMQKIKKAMETLESMKFNPFSTGRFAVIENGELVRIADNGEAVKLIQQPRQCVLIPLWDPEAEE